MRFIALLLILCIQANLESQEKTTRPDFKTKPQVNWIFSTNYSVYASPLVTDSIVYIGGLDSTLYSINLYSGIENWKFKSKGQIRSQVCAKGKYLYLNGGDGNLYCLDARTGKKIWIFKTKGEKKYDFADYFNSSPVVFENILFFGSGDHNLYALNAQTGNKIWAFLTNGIVHSTPVIANQKIFFGSFDGYVYALNLKNGTLAWKFKTVGHRYFPLGEVQGSPAAYDGKVFIGARDYNVYALDQEKGFCHWNKAFKDGWGLCNTLNNGILYIGSADERKLIAVDPKSGSEFWNKKMEFLVFGNCAFSDSMLYVGTTIGKLHGINLNTGEKIWSYETENYLQNKQKYFKPDDSYRDDIYSIIKSNEQFLEVECELGGIFSTPAIVNGFIVFSSTNGKIYCLEN
ncbi:MAG: PQQ-binding-like beta-propeller repeat protein [Bacteroidales bacterium]